MLLENKTVLIMGIRNKWSIAWGAARSAADNGAKVLFTFMGEENRGKIEELFLKYLMQRLMNVMLQMMKK